MHPTIGYHLSQDHLADLRSQAQHRARANAARRDRRMRPPRSGHPSPNAAGMAGRVLTTLATRST